MSEPHELEERAVRALCDCPDVEAYTRPSERCIYPLCTAEGYPHPRCISNAKQARAILALVRQEQEKAPDEAMVKAALKACGFDEAKSSLKFFEDAGIIKVRGIKWTGDVEYAAMIRAWWLSHTAPQEK